jgi:hypothetical protein
MSLDFLFVDDQFGRFIDMDNRNDYGVAMLR